MIKGLSSWCKIIHVSLMLYCPHCKNSHVMPGSPREGAHTGRMSLEMEIAVDLEGKHELCVFAGFIFSSEVEKQL